MTRLFLFLFLGMLCATGCTEKIESNDDNTIASGTAGELTWILRKDGTLIVKGKGVMPDYLYFSSVPPWYEYRDDITDVLIGDDVSNIGNEAFHFCSKMTSVYIGNSITVIGNNAFDNCTSLTAVDIPNSVTQIGYWAFGYCTSLTSINIPNSVTDIGALAFAHCTGLSSVTIGNSATTIGGATFIGCHSLTEIVNYNEAPQDISTYVKEHLAYTTDPFAGVDMAKCTLLVPAGSEKAYRTNGTWGNFPKIGAIGEPVLVIAGGREAPAHLGTFLLFTWWLYNDGTLTINGNRMPGYNTLSPGGAKIFGYAPWYDNEEYRNSITSVMIEEGIINISTYAFYQCSNITSITIPCSVIDISDVATFTGCQNITEIINHQSTPQIISGSVFEDVNKTGCTLLVPAGSETAYRSAEGWKDFVNVKAIDSTSELMIFDYHKIQ